ncbi:MAG: PEP-CTERM/exosortase system-associated acyltransferase [Candidatus Nitrosoglobus sp.]
MPIINNFIDTFYNYFELVPAHSGEFKKEVYKLRYQVYCNETGFENSKDHPGGIEFDEYDSHSVHYLIRHRTSGAYAATTRLILPHINSCERLFPIEKYTKIDSIELLKNIPRENLAEASRFCVSKDFKRRKNESGTLMGRLEPVGIGLDWVGEEERRIFPHITIGLFACLIRMSFENNIHYWYAVMEPALARSFSLLGIYFVAIGPLTDYHGKRRPYIIKISDLLSSVAKKDLNYWNMLSNKGRYLG